MSEFVEALLRLLSTIGGEFTHFLGQARALPRIGVQLRALQAVSLSGEDLGPRHRATGFMFALPLHALVRVERAPDQKADSLWVRPVDPALVALVPPACQKSARAYGYVLEVPPALLRTHFEVVAH